MPGTSQIRASAHTSLTPDRFWLLLADPHFYARWSEIRGIKAEEIDAPPGLATAGTTITMRGTIRRIRFTSTTVVTRAERPSLFEARSEMRFDSARALASAAASVDRYDIAPDPSGSLVTLTSTVMSTTSVFPLNVIVWLQLRLFGRRAYRNALAEMLRSAERYVTGSQVG